MDSLELTIVTSVSDGDDEHFYVCPSFETTATNDAAPQNEARRLGGGVVHHRKGGEEMHGMQSRVYLLS